MTSQEAFKYTCKPGYWLVNVSNVDQEQNWQEQVMPLPETDTLFGYDQDVFLRKQYK